MTHNPPVQSAPVETKVKAATVGATAAGLVVALLTWFSANQDAVAGMPNWLSGLIALLLPPLITFFSGYSAKHTIR